MSTILSRLALEFMGASVNNTLQFEGVIPVWRQIKGGSMVHEPDASIKTNRSSKKPQNPAILTQQTPHFNLERGEDAKRILEWDVKLKPLSK